MISKNYFTTLSVISLLFLFVRPGLAQGDTTITGIVYHDLNNDDNHDRNEPGIPGIFVSNGRDISVADEDGRYTIQAMDDAIYFVIKPRDWTTSVDENGIPRFYNIQSRGGAGGTGYQGLAPTDEITSTIDFALYPQDESDEFNVLVFGDTQARDLDEISYIAHDTVQENIGSDVAFGTTLGDLLFDDLDLFQSLNETVGQIGVPWRHVIGNHDIDFAEDTDWDTRGTYHRIYGPSYYAFVWGSAHFLVVDNVRWVVEGDERNWMTGLGENQMQFITSYLDRVPEDELVVIFSHIPWVDSTPWAVESERDSVFELLASHNNIVTFAAHTHQHYHRFIDQDDGWTNEKPHHLVSVGTVAGSWWSGAPDEYGIPHSMMQDGTPTGYAILEIQDSDWKLRYKASRRPDDFQMHIYGPDEVKVDISGDIEIFANIFNALPDANVVMSIGDGEQWQPMVTAETGDPFYELMKNREDSLENVSWRRGGNADPNPRHLWKATLPDGLEPGTYTILVHSEDKWNEYEGRRIIRVTE